MVLSVLLAQICFANGTTNLSALVSSDIDDFSLAQINSLKNQINSLDNKSYNDFLASLVAKADDYELLQNNLKLLGVELVNFKVKNVSNTNNEFVLMSSPNNASIITYANKRHGDSYYRLYAQYNLTYREWYAGSQDVILMYFNNNMANYYSYNCESNYTTLRSGQYATSGTLAFNFSDAAAGTNTSYAVTYVTPKSGTQGQWLDFGADWVHTYLEEDTQSSFSTSLNFGGTGGVTGSIGCTVTVSTNQYDWSLADTNAVQF